MIGVRGNKLIITGHDLSRAELAQVISLAPRLSQGTIDGQLAAVFAYSPDAYALLQSAGVRVPSPILCDYDWAGDTPFESQKQTAALMTTSRRCYVLSSMGVGKTRAAVYSCDYLIKTAGAKKVLIIAPLSTLNDVWSRELFSVTPDHTRVVLYGTREKRLKLLASNSTFNIINPEGVVSLRRELAAIDWDIVVIDELAAYRNAQTVRWEALRPIVSRARWAWGMTGSPTPNSPVDAFGQLKMLTPSRVPNSFRRFRLDLMDQVSQFKWQPKPDATKRVYDLMQPSVRYTLDECHDLPELTYSTRTIEMSPTQKRLYDQMMKDCKAQFASGQVTAVNEGVKIQKLLQLSAGFAYDENGRAMWCGSPDRIKELISLVEQAEKKVLVFGSYKWLVNTLAKVLESVGFSTGVITGDVSKRDRDVIFQRFRDPKDLQVICAHPGTMSHGLTLTQANVSVWYGPTASPDFWNQANARTRRPGQTAHTHVVCIQSSDVERRAFARLQRKQKMEGLLLDMFRGVGE